MLGLLPAHPWLKKAKQGDGQPVMVLPGFGAADYTTIFLRKFIKQWGYPAYPWMQGSNLDPKVVKNMDDVMAGIEVIVDNLRPRLDSMIQRHGQKASLIGWSLGGVISRLIASKHPELVRQVITLGTPFGDLRGVSITHYYARFTGSAISDSDVEKWIRLSQPKLTDIPITAIYSKGDGFLSPKVAELPKADKVENILVPASHIGFGVNPVVYKVIADRLSESEDNWQPFKQMQLLGLPLTR